MKKTRLLLLTPLIGLLAACGSSGPKGYNDPVKLASSIEQTANDNLSNPASKDYTPGGSITSVVCIKSGKLTFICAVQGSDGSHDSVTATVTPDGSNWVTS